MVIARNEERRIAACLDAVVGLVAPFERTQIVVVDSDSTDNTALVAARYPVHLFRYRARELTAAAGRRIGFERVNAEYVLFVDGDCVLAPGWLKLALDFMEQHPEVGVIHGLRAEEYEGVSRHFESASPRPEEYSLGGNGLYRSEILSKVGGFNPYIIGSEDGELLARIHKAGYQDHRTREIMFTHRTHPKDTLREIIPRRRLQRGIGQVFRVALGQGTFALHARRRSAYLVTFAYLGLGLMFAAIGGLTHDFWLLGAWLAVGALAFLLLAWRRRSLRSAVTLAIEWVSVALLMPFSFAERPQSSELFRPDVVAIPTALDGDLQGPRMAKSESQ